ncbi:AAA family ATPase [Vandammella animalimorsus]|uniref:AAA family ATPase n=1 Tax=Vandammella animalimorsus TaxID=2029117 RepID=A0A3M6RVA6_9BURK|nr:AAA family ATPase [Vandammella animalimorsus]RMX18834.1 AAA family ATPase [Vandammella animalimorsus]
MTSQNQPPKGKDTGSAAEQPAPPTNHPASAARAGTASLPAAGDAEHQQLMQRLVARSHALQQVAQQLKQELFGIDAIIDRVIDTIRAWYVMPELIQRPVIVCLWGLTGTGKTQLTRSLARKLGFYDRFVEVQMDGFSHGTSSWHGAGSISRILESSGIDEGEPGILVLDEFQRYRTLNEQRQEVEVQRYQDVWALLSDGRLPPSVSFLGELESTLAEARYDEQQRSPGERRALTKKPLRVSAYEAQSLKRALKLKEPLLEIMAWSPERVEQELARVRGSEQSWETDYSRLLIFVCGNLDEMYESLARRVEDCDTDADVFHSHSLRLSLIDVKRALAQRFKPEQVARLGNQHLIYPSLNRAAYTRIIDEHCAQYSEQMQHSTGLHFVITPEVRREIYANGVFPAQGTRPLFSTLHAVLGTPLVNAAVWALGLGAPAGSTVEVRLGSDGQSLCAHALGQQLHCPVAFEVRTLRQRTLSDFRALLAVHEAGHGLVHALLFGSAPQEIRINVASFEGGYAMFSDLQSWSRSNWLDRIAVCLAGRAAENVVFGADACSSGAEQDIQHATEYASRFVRFLGYGERLARTDVTSETNEHLNTDVQPSNLAIEAILQAQMQRSTALIAAHRQQLLTLVDELMRHGELGRQRLAELLGVPMAPQDPMVLTDYAQRLQAFAQRALSS